MPQKPHFISDSSQGIAAAVFYDVWRNRDLLYFFTWRDFKVRYRQAVLGAVWVLLQPILLITIFSILLGRYAGISSDGHPYPVFAFCGILPWLLFSGSLANTSTSLVEHRQLLTKIYFPRILLPISAALVAAIDFIIGMSIFIGLAMMYDIQPTLRLLITPVLMICTLMCSLSIGVLVSALTVKYRDFQYIMPFVLQFGFFLCPIVYSASIIPESISWLYYLNPMTSIIESFRWVVLGDSDISATKILLSSMITLVFSIVSVVYFKSHERTFSDYV